MSKQPAEVSAMFDAVAESYDKTNDLLSFGMAKSWRKAVRKMVNPKPGQRILDLAAGTGTSSMALLVEGATVVAADFSKGMLAEGRKRHPKIEFAFADAMALPFKDAEFDAVTISFGIRNVQDHRVALKEMLRVLKPGGRLVVCEFSKVTGLLGFAYNFYLTRLLPLFSRLASKTPAAYGYLAESIRAWPDQAQFADHISAAGFKRVTYKNLTLGVVALHTAVKAQ